MACFDPRIDGKLFFAKGLVSTSVHLVGAGEFEPASFGWIHVCSYLGAGTRI